MADKDFDNKKYWHKRIIDSVESMNATLSYQMQEYAKICEHVGVTPDQIKMAQIGLFSGFEQLKTAVNNTFLPEKVKEVKEKKE